MIPSVAPPPAAAQVVVQRTAPATNAADTVQSNPTAILPGRGGRGAGFGNRRARRAAAAAVNRQHRRQLFPKLLRRAAPQLAALKFV